MCLTHEGVCLSLHLSSIPHFQIIFLVFYVFIRLKAFTLNLTFGGSFPKRPHLELDFCHISSRLIFPKIMFSFLFNFNFCLLSKF